MTWIEVEDEIIKKIESRNSFSSKNKFLEILYIELKTNDISEKTIKKVINSIIKKTNIA